MHDYLESTSSGRSASPSGTVSVVRWRFALWTSGSRTAIRPRRSPGVLREQGPQLRDGLPHGLRDAWLRGTSCLLRGLLRTGWLPHYGTPVRGSWARLGEAPEHAAAAARDFVNSEN